MKQFYIFGQAYGEGVYGDCAYQSTQQQLEACNPSTGGGTTGTGSGTGTGSLVDTGVAIAFAVTLACLLIFATIVVRFIRRPRVAVQEVDSSQDRDANRDMRS